MSVIDNPDLRRILSGMDLPFYRKSDFTPRNLEWLAKNLGERNMGHPNYSQAMAMIVAMLPAKLAKKWSESSESSVK